MKFRNIIAGFGILLSVSMHGQTGSTSITTTAVPFLRISPDARSGGMGDAGVAITPDANASFWNVAKLPFAQRKSGVSATYSPWLKDINGEMFLGSLTGYRQLGNDQALSASLRYFNMGNIDQHDYSGTYLQTAQPREFAIDLGYSRKLSDRNGVGLTFRYINSRLIQGNVGGNQIRNGSSVAADLGYYHNGLDTKGQGWTWGVALSNLGSKMSYTNNNNRKDFIPAKLGIGLARTTVFNDDNKLLITADVNKLLVPAVPLDSSQIISYQQKGVVESWFQSFNDYDRLAVSLGAEYSYREMFHLRAGYFAESKNEGARRYFTAGAGVHYSSFGINFSYLVPFDMNNIGGRNPLSNTLRFSVLFNMDK